MTTAPLTEQQLDEITARAAHLHEYATLTDGPLQADADQLTGEDVPALLAELRRRGAALTEMTHCRDNALRALYRDDVETDIDLEETIAAPFYGPGWDWDASDLKPVVREAADAVRPAFGKLTQERDRLRADAAAELMPVWEAVYEPGNVSDYLIGYMNDQDAATGAAEAWMRSQAEVTGRLEWVPWGDVTPMPDGYDRWFELGQQHDDGIDTDSGIVVRRRKEPTSAPLDASHGPAGDRDGETGTEGAAGREGDPRRILTPNEYSAAWHAVEGSAGEEGADPGTVLHAVLNRLGIDTPAAEETATEAGR